MRRLFCASLTLVTLGLARLALSETSTVEAVRLYPDGARILRTADFAVAAGQSTVEIEIPANQNWQTTTLQVSVSAETAVSILGVAARTLDAGAAPSALQDEIDALRIEISAIKADAQTARGLADALRGLIDRSTLADVSATDMLTLFATAQDGISDLNAQAQAAEQALEEKSDALDALLREQRERGEGLPTRVIELTLNAEAATDALFTLTYLTRAAYWSPHYETTLDSTGAEAALTIVQNAELTQQTGESWDDVGVVLSTAQAFANTQMPELDPWFLYAQTKNLLRSASQGMVMQDVAVMAAPSTGMAEGGFSNFASDLSELTRPSDRGSVTMAGLFAEIVLDGPQDLEPGMAPTQVRLQTTPLTVDLSRRTTPVINPTVYLFAAFKNDTGAALLPGPATLFHNDRFAGVGFMPALQPGESAEMAFGADERITVTRTLLDRSSGDRGLFRGKRRLERDYAIMVSNFHDTAIEVQIFDQLPVAEDEAVSVNLLDTSTRPTAIDFEGKKGILQWVAPVKPGMESTVRFGFELLQPDDRPLPFLR